MFKGAIESCALLFLLHLVIASEPILFQDPVYDNIALGCTGGVSKADVEQAAKLAGRSVFTFLR